jgi:hypothetical protein
MPPKNRANPWAARRDRNHKSVVKALRADGFFVLDTGSKGGGFPDLLVGLVAEGIGPYCVLIEIKDGDKAYCDRPLTPHQRKFFQEYPGPLALVRSDEEALTLCRALRAGDLTVIERPTG